MSWMTCDACGEVLLDPHRELARLDRQAPCCGATGMRTMWPSTARGALEAVQKLDLASAEGSRSGCLFLAAVLEALTESTLWTLLERLSTTRPVAYALMNRMRGRKDLLDTYRSLTNQSVRQVLEPNPELRAWFADWELLVAERNQLAHGRWHSTSPRPLPELVQAVNRCVLPAMAEVRNHGLRAIRTPPTPN